MPASPLKKCMKSMDATYILNLINRYRQNMNKILTKS
nr:MAG TPA: hypothetical protein [Caudoviricetes sp.]